MKPDWKADMERKKESQDRINERRQRWKAENPEAYRAYRDREKERKKERRRAGEKIDAPYKPVSDLSAEELEKRRAFERERKRKYRAEKAAQNAQSQAHASKYPDPSAGYAEAVNDASERTGVVNLQGQDVDFATAWGYTDTDLRAQVITQLPSTATDQELMDAYCALHFNRYGEEFDF